MLGSAPCVCGFTTGMFIPTNTAHRVDDRSECIYVNGGPFDGEQMDIDRFRSVLSASTVQKFAVDIFEEENMYWAPDPKLWEQG